MNLNKLVAGVAVVILLSAGLGVSIGTAKETPAGERGDPWSMFEQIRDQIEELSERVAALEQGGSEQGAGDVAFIFWNTDGVHVLKNDGTVWKCPSCGWVLDDQPYDLTPPVPVEDIVQWKLVTFLDKDGDVWQFTESLGWRNYGHP